MASPLKQIEEDRVDIDAILRSASERPPPPPSPDVPSMGPSPLHGLLETDAERSTRRRRRLLALATGVVLAGSTGAFVANRTRRPTAAPPVPVVASSTRPASRAPTVPTAPREEVVLAGATALAAPPAMVEAIPSTSARLELPAAAPTEGRGRRSTRRVFELR